MAKTITYEGQLLCGFEKQDEIAMWKRVEGTYNPRHKFTLELSRDYVEEGSSSLKVTFPKGPYPSIIWDTLPRNDWSNYQSFECDIYNPQDVAVKVTGNIGSVWNKTYYGLYGKVIGPKQWYHLKYDLDKVAKSLDLKQMKFIAFYPDPSPRRGTVLYFDNLRLIPK